MELYPGLQFKIEDECNDFKGVVFEITDVFKMHCTCRDGWPFGNQELKEPHYHFTAKAVEAPAGQEWRLQQKEYIFNDIGDNLESTGPHNYKIVPIGAIQTSLFG